MPSNSRRSRHVDSSDIRGLVVMMDENRTRSEATDGHCTDAQEESVFYLS